MYGLGNWSDVADHVGTKEKQQCEQHYYAVYLESKSAPLPDPNRLVKPEEYNKKPDKEDDSDSKSTKAKPPGKKRTGLGGLVGYIPKRGDFETEYENDAELLLADMEFKDDDTPVERDLKLKMLQIYNEKLDARLERKQFILKRGLLDGSKSRARSADEKQIEENFRVFARFHSQESHRKLIEGLCEEVRLRKRIKQLQNWRLSGIRTMEEGQLFEQHLKKREAARKSKDETTARNRKRAALEDLKSNRALKQAKSDPLNVDDLEDAELLSIAERKLCSELRLIPRHYMIIKHTLINECLARGFLQANQAKALIKIDVNKTGKIFDFFVSAGWVNETETVALLPTKPVVPVATTTATPMATDAPSQSTSSSASAAAAAAAAAASGDASSASAAAASC
jgi:transcriptional adapter 2-alpha